MKSSIVLLFTLLWVGLSLPTIAEAQFFAELSYNLWRDECPKYSAEESGTLCPSPLEKTSPQAQKLRTNMGDVAERALLGSLAAEKSKIYECTLTQFSSLQNNPQDTQTFLDDYVAKLILLGHEKRTINELRRKQGKSKADLENYDRAIQRAEALLRSMPFADLKPFQEVIQFTAQQYDQYTPDRLETWLPGKLKGLLQKALPAAKTQILKDKAILDTGAETFGESLENTQREVLAQDSELIASFRQKSKGSEKNITPTLCRIDAKYGRGAQYRDNALLGVSLLALPATGLLRVGAAGVTSSLKGISTLSSLSVRSAAVLRVLAASGGTTFGISQIHKSCIAQHTELASENKSDQDPANSCDGNILKSQIQENCVLAATLSALGLPLSAKGVKETYAQLQKAITVKKNQDAAIQKAHQVGRGEIGEDGNLAKVGNYTFSQKRKKAQILKEAGVGKKERRKLFENKTVGDGDYIEELIDIENEIVKIEKASWRSQGGAMDLSDDLISLRSELDEALDASPTEMPERLSKLREKLSKIATQKEAPASALRVEDILENPKALRSGQAVPLNPGAKNPVAIKFDTEAIDDLSKAEKNIVQKFVNSLRVGVAGDSIDPTKIKYLSGLDHGSKGKVFEVRIINRGHQRLLGCYQNGLFTVLKYDPHAPETVQGFNLRYKDLCK